MKATIFLPALLVTMLLVSCQLVPLSAQAQLDVRFVESAPKDRFIVENSGNCEISESTVTIDLAESAGKLIFDTTESGAGVEVFQPFEVAEGQIELISSNGVNDGDSQLTVRVASLSPGQSVGFTIDVDDTLPNSELGMIRVSGSEINGGLVRIVATGQESLEIAAEAIFEGSFATLFLPCVAR